MARLGPVVTRRTIPASRAEAWQLLVDPELRADWWSDVRLDATIGGEILRGADGDSAAGAVRHAQGAVDLVVPEHTLGFRWRGDADPFDTSVTVMLRPDDEDPEQTAVTVIESGFAALPDAEERVRQARAAWEEALGHLLGQDETDAADETDADETDTDETDADETGTEGETSLDAADASLRDTRSDEAPADGESTEPETHDSEFQYPATEGLAPEESEPEAAEPEIVEPEVVEPEHLTADVPATAETSGASDGEELIEIDAEDVEDSGDYVEGEFDEPSWDVIINGDPRA